MGPGIGGGDVAVFAGGDPGNVAKRCGWTEEVAAAVTVLCRERARSVTGETRRVDGGPVTARDG